MRGANVWTDDPFKTTLATDHGDNSGTLSWTPDTTQSGTYGRSSILG